MSDAKPPANDAEPPLVAVLNLRDWGIVLGHLQLGRYADVVEVIDARWASNSNPLYYVAAAADPVTREEILSSVKNRVQFVNGWRAAAKSGYAPRTGQSNGGS
jgi:hypothetical protein